MVLTKMMNIIKLSICKILLKNNIIFFQKILIIRNFFIFLYFNKYMENPLLLDLEKKKEIIKNEKLEKKIINEIKKK